MKLLPILATLLLLAFAHPARACVQPAADPCALDTNLSLGQGRHVIERTISVAPDALPLERPLILEIAALASSEVFWNGRLIGRNGVPSDNAKGEKPGRYYAAIPIPASSIRPGENQLRVRLSAERLWLPVRRPVHQLSVGLYETPALPGRARYLPALLAMGALAAAFVFFSSSAYRARGGDRQALLLTALSVVSILQLGAEVSRAFVDYTYPWQLGRLALIAATAAAGGVLIAAYASDRFAPEQGRRSTVLVAALSAANLLLIPSFDAKATGALLAGFMALGLCGFLGSRRGVAGGRWAIAASVAAVLLILWRPTAFLDRDFYLLAAVMLVSLVVEQVGALRSARARVLDLETRLREAEEAGEPIVSLKQGARVYRVVQADILSARAADDYCEVRLRDGRNILVTTTLGRLLAQAPGALVRVHKSYAVNRAEVVTVQARPNGGRQITLSDSSTVPIGRSYASVFD